jgi:chemotaxis protein methyltransferase CheR
MPALTERELRAIVDLVYQKSGITLHDGKRGLISARLQRRLRTGGFRTFAEYLTHVQRDTTGQELTLLLDAIATNHTSFFREESHFELMKQRFVPELVARRAMAVNGWCAACSTGEEPFTIMMTLLESLPSPLRDRVSLSASDLSTKALTVARDATYPLSRLAGIPNALVHRYFERHPSQPDYARVKQEVRRAVDFKRLNLLEINDLGKKFDFIFCRNVMIYFDQPVRQRVVSMLERHLAPGGYLFVSCSESLNTLTHKLQWVAPAVYQRRIV